MPATSRLHARSRLVACGLAALVAWAAATTAAPAAPPDRAAAVEAWLVMQERAQTPAGWSGNVPGCVVGTESAESVAATLGTVNALRDFAGVGPVTFDPALNAKALAAALMMRAQGDLSHTPGPTWACYSAEGANGAANSNLYLGLSGPRAMSGYVFDEGVDSLGHRRWLLNPRRGTFGTGSTGTTNALYVRGAPAVSPVVPEVVAWPPPGHIPWPLVMGSWSAALNVDATINASAAQVSVWTGGRALPVSGVTNMGGGYGDGHLIKFDVALAAADRDADRTIDVVIDGVTAGGVARQFRYSINAIAVDVPAATTYSATRTASTVTVSWAAAAERGVPVTGYRIDGFDGQPAIDHTVGASVRQVTLPYTAPSTSLLVRVIALSRAGSPPPGSYVSVAPPAGVPVRTPAAPPGTMAPKPGSAATRARIVGAVTLRLVRPGRLRVGSRLKVSADVRGHRLLRHRWLRNGRPISGAARSTYTVRRVDRGRRISCRLTAVGADGVATTRTSTSRRIPRR